MAKINLPNENAYGKLTVTPVNWETGDDNWKVNFIIIFFADIQGMR